MLCQTDRQKDSMNDCSEHFQFLIGILCSMATIHLLIKGKVQGVFYRASAKEKAQALGLKGWIRNTKDGDVECVASGDEKATGQFIEWCKMGPAKASVTSVDVKPVDDEEFDGFQIRRS
jgi:acylphosphatase